MRNLGEHTRRKGRISSLLSSPFLPHRCERSRLQRGARGAAVHGAGRAGFPDSVHERVERQVELDAMRLPVDQYRFEAAAFDELAQEARVTIVVGAADSD